MNVLGLAHIMALQMMQRNNRIKGAAAPNGFSSLLHFQ